MKNRKNKVFILTLICMLLLFIKVDAASCTTAEKKLLKEKASKIEFVSSFHEEEDGSLSYFVYVTNFSDDFYIENSRGNHHEYTENYIENVFDIQLPGSEITYKVYGAYGKTCSQELLVTRKIKFDYYNSYSTHEACEGIEEFSLCRRNYSGTIESEEWFLKQVEAYKNQLKEAPQEKKESTILKFIKEYPLIIILFIAIILVIVLLLIRKKKDKNKIKVDLKSLKHHIFLIFLLLCLFPVNIEGQTVDGSIDGKPSPSEGATIDKYAWSTGDGSIWEGVRLGLYHYDGRKLTFIKSVNFVNEKEYFSSVCYPGDGNTSRFQYTDYQNVKFNTNCKQLKSVHELGTGIVEDFSKIDRQSTWAVKFKEELIKYLEKEDSSLKVQLETLFGNNIILDTSKITQYYIIIEPTTKIYNKKQQKSYYGTGFEFINSDFRCTKYNDDGSENYSLPLFCETYSSSATTRMVGYLFNGMYVGKNNAVEFDENNFVNAEGNPLVLTVNNPIAGDSIRKEFFKLTTNGKIPTNFSYGMGIVWMGQLAKTSIDCNNTCSNKKGDELLECAEKFCQQQSDVTNSSEKESCIKACGYTPETLKCSYDTVELGKDTVCAGTTSSFRNSCNIFKKNNILYKADCTTYSTTTYPMSLPTTLSAGSGFKYQVGIHGNKTCTITFDSEWWKFKYASSYTKEERQSYIDAVKEFNNMDFNSESNIIKYSYDSGDANISIKINEKINGKNSLVNKTLKVDNNYYMGSKRVTSTFDYVALNGFYTGGVYMTHVKTYKTDSSNGSYYNLPGICIDPKDNQTIKEGATCEYGLGPYNQYFTNIYSDANKNDTETVVYQDSAGMSVKNTCDYTVKEEKLSCYITVETASNQKGNILVNDEDIVFKIHSVSNIKGALLSFIDTPHLKDPTMSGITTKTIKKDTVKSNKEETVYGVVYDEKSYAYCQKKVTITAPKNVSCEFDVKLNDDGTKTVSLKNKSEAIKYSLKDSTSNTWMNLMSKTINDNINITIWGEIELSSGKKETCLIEFKKEEPGGDLPGGDPDGYTCTKKFKPAEYSKIKKYCSDNWSKDTAAYSSEEDCYTSCSNDYKKETCKNQYSCSDTKGIIEYCKYSYQLDGYKSVGSCINDCSCGINGLNYYYRTISLKTPFPERDAHANWLGYEEYITNDYEDSTPSLNSGRPEYEIVLDSKKISAIKKHTKKYISSGKDNDAYGDFIRVDEDDTGSYKSKFINVDDIEEGGFSSYFTYIAGVKVGG